MFKYFKGRISQGFVSLYSGRMVLWISDGLLGLFLPIFLYKLFNFDLNKVIYYYLIGNLLYGATVAWGARYLDKVGLRRSLRISIVWGAAFYFIFYLIDRGTKMPEWLWSYKEIIFFLILSVFFLTLNRLMYWIPLHTDLAKFTSKSNRAKQLGLMGATTIAIGAVMPLLAGWILTHYSYDILFLIAILTFFISLIPFATLPKTKEIFSWSYLQTWREFFSRRRRKAVLAYFGDGAESIISTIIWPIFIWELLSGNYFQVGALSSLIVVITIFLQLSVGRFADKGNKNKMLKYGSIFYALGWIIKIFIATAFQIFITSTYHNLARIFARTPFDVLNYERTADQGHYIDEYTVIHEMAVQFGKSFMLIFVLLLLPFFNIQWMFVLAAVASLSMNFLADEEIIKRESIID
ncbi:MAG: MFS transporter [Patescibacteria group bacterium]|nr:MFS transporter [Patescibacteria group bacterium]MDD5294973.1 MFS transporter [Patescibacteria group bacterium]MDD5554510.1 MFS transporter [Patescibacteria group bacterium]